MGSENFETNFLDFTEFWENTGVHSEVLRGAKVREEKPNCSKKQQQFTPVNININDSVNNMHKHRRGKRKPGTSTKKYSRCPMRIAELAVPTKRQCLDTWRNRGKTLPNFMVERLRQQVMDQKAVVHINDAINCFKLHKLKRSRHNKLKSIKKGHNIDKAKLFCAIFGHRIVLKLLPPGRLPIPTRFKNLTEIINNDIKQLLRRRKTNDFHKTIQDEIVEKVTVWIASVLDDSDINLMMDDLQDLKEKEGHVWDIIDDLIESVAENCKSESISYTEEKSPSRTSSFISIDSNKSSLSSISLNKEEKTSLNDINNNIAPNTNKSVIKMMDVILFDIIDSIYRYESQINGFIENLLYNTVSVIANTKQGINTDDEIKIMDTAKDLSQITNLENNIDLTDIPKSNISNIAFNLENKEQIENTDEQNNFDNETHDVPSDTSSHGTVNIIVNQSKNIDNEEGASKIQLTETAVEETEQTQELSDALNQLTVETNPRNENASDIIISPENIELELKESEEWSDDSFKKVKFSNTNIGNKQRSIDGDSKYNISETSFLNKKFSSISASKQLKNINFSPPNTHLLYNVDETWPEDFLPLTTKLSATVSKSVLSLGLINEADEKSILSPNTFKETKQNVEEQFVAEICNLSEEIIKEDNDLHNTYLLNTNKAIKSKYKELYQTSQGSGSACLDIKRSHEQGDNGDSKAILINDIGKSQNTRQLKVNVLSSININSEIKLSSAKRPTKEKQIQTDAQKIKLTPKYKPKRQHEIRFMCKGLYNVVINMEKWLNWIICVTDIIAAKLRQYDTNSIKTQKDKDDYLKEWLQLKESIDSDCKLWHHLYKRLSIGINNYKICNKDNNFQIKSVQPKSCIKCRGF